MIIRLRKDPAQLLSLLVVVLLALFLLNGCTAVGRSLGKEIDEKNATYTEPPLDSLDQYVDSGNYIYLSTKDGDLYKGVIYTLVQDERLVLSLDKEFFDSVLEEFDWRDIDKVIVVHSNSNATAGLMLLGGLVDIAAVVTLLMFIALIAAVAGMANP